MAALASGGRLNNAVSDNWATGSWMPLAGVEHTRGEPGENAGPGSQFCQHG